ncbi:hypothetical protein [Candidatus Anaplasma sp. TIGMIC]|uniref:hypothetical protein n=1 Tax=Candidatus Anaplasma sp. TIGMIC TaxID=3020713 RepID=UPI00232B9CF3|nr:hypothetical protein [Candidatus Anaplasma sp. TIGMIC]MDB1135729.1 hypothetical protein [Candidatus Anaplasma sp. TIGMIC]
MKKETKRVAGGENVTEPTGHITESAEDQSAIFSSAISDSLEDSGDDPTVVPGSAAWVSKTKAMIGDSKQGLNTLLARMKEFWSGHKVTSLPKEAGFTPGVSIPVRLSSYGATVSFVGMAVAAYMVGRYLRREISDVSLTSLRVISHSTTPIHIKVYAAIAVISLIAFTACVIVSEIYKNKARKARDKLLLVLYEKAKVYTECRPPIDYQSLRTVNMLRQVCDVATTRIVYLEENDTSRAALMDAVERIQLKHDGDMAELRGNTLEGLSQMNRALQDVTAQIQRDGRTAVEAVHSEITSLEQHIKCCEQHFKAASEQVRRAASHQTDVMRSVLQKGLETAVRKTEELQDTVANFNINMAFVIKSNVYDTKRQVEHLLKVHLECLSFISTLFSKEGIAAVSVCVFILRSHDHMGKVHYMHSRRVYHGMKGSLEYQVPGVFKGLFRETRTIDETIASVYSILSVELNPILGLADELMEVVTSGQGLGKHRDTCCRVMKDCHEKLFGSQGLLKEGVYENFYKKLCSVLLESDGTAEGGTVACSENDDAMQRIRSCAPFFMTIPHIINVARGIEGIHKTADDMYKVCKDVERSLDSVFGFLPKSIAVPSDITEPKADSLQDEKQMDCA